MADLETTLGLKGCSTEQKKQKLEKMYDDFLEDVNDTFNEIASNIYGPFLPTLFALTSQLGAGVAMDYATFLGKMVTRNTVGGFVASVGLAVASLNGSKTLLKYAAAKRLQETLKRREALSLALLDEVESLLSLLQSFKNIDINTNEAFLGEVREALLEVKKAALIVSREDSKIQGGDPIQFTQNPVSPRNLQRAVEHIEEALIFLGGSQLSGDLYEDKLNNLNRKYALKVIPKTDFTDSVGIANPINIVNYFKETTTQIREDNTLDGVLTKEGRKLLQYYIIDFINTPGISDFFKTFAAAGLLGDHVSTLGERIPIRSSVSASFAKEAAKKSLGGLFGPVSDLAEDVGDIQDNIFSYLKLQPYGTEMKFPDDDTTLKLSGMEVLTAQTSILTISDRFNSLQVQTGYLKKFLTPALSNLDDVRRGMEDVIYMGESSIGFSQSFSLPSYKIDWMGRLSLAKTLISSGVETPAYLGSGKRPINPYDVNKKFAESDAIYEDLQSMIRARLLDENGEPIPTQSEQIVEIANQTLSSFALGPMALFNPRARDKAIGGLQSIRLLLRNQISDDSKELSEVTFYIDSVESNPLFASTIKPAWDELMKRLNATGMGKAMAKYLSRGNISKVLDALDAGTFAKDSVKEFFECGEEPIGPEDRMRVKNMASIIGLDGDDAVKKMRDADSQISRLINKGKMLKIVEDQTA